MVEVTVRTAPKATSVINCGSAIMCVVHWPRNSAIRLTLSRLLWTKRKLVAYNRLMTLRQVRRLQHKWNHSHITGVASKHTPSTVTIIATSTSKKVLCLTYNNVQLVDVTSKANIVSAPKLKSLPRRLNLFFNPTYWEFKCIVASGNMMTRQSQLTLTQPCMDGIEMPSTKLRNRHCFPPTGVWHLIRPMFMLSCDAVLYNILRVQNVDWIDPMSTLKWRWKT